MSKGTYIVVAYLYNFNHKKHEYPVALLLVDYMNAYMYQVFVHSCKLAGFT